jgi:hypothetical protein
MVHKDPAANIGAEVLLDLNNHHNRWRELRLNNFRILHSVSCALQKALNWPP